MADHDAVLPTIQGPDDLNALTVDQRALLAREIREEICQTVSKNGGHFGANTGVPHDLIAGRIEDRVQRDRELDDAHVGAEVAPVLADGLADLFADLPRQQSALVPSHQCYPHKLLTGRQDVFPSLRTYGGMSGFCHKGESDHDTAYAGHAGTAVSIAVGIAQGNHMTDPDRHAIAVVGDSAMVSGMTLEALNSAGWLDARVLTLTVWSASINASQSWPSTGPW